MQSCMALTQQHRARLCHCPGLLTRRCRACLTHERPSTCWSPECRCTAAWWPGSQHPHRFRLLSQGPVSIMAHSLGSVLTYDVLCNQPPLDAHAVNPNPNPTPDATPQSSEDAAAAAPGRSAAAGGQGAVQGSAPGSGAGPGSSSGLHAEPSLLPLSSADLGLPVTSAPDSARQSQISQLAEVCSISCSHVADTGIQKRRGASALGSEPTCVCFFVYLYQ